MYMLQLLKEQKIIFFHNLKTAKKAYKQALLEYKASFGRYTSENDFFETEIVGDVLFYENDECVIKLYKIYPQDMYTGQLDYFGKMK